MRALALLFPLGFLAGAIVATLLCSVTMNAMRETPLPCLIAAALPDSALPIDPQ